jgi:hypothetical protein
VLRGRLATDAIPRAAPVDGLSERGPEKRRALAGKLSELWRGLTIAAMAQEDAANRRARQAATVVAVVGLIVVFLPAAFHARDVFGDPFRAGTTTKTVTTTVGNETTKTETTTSPSAQSLLDRGLATGGLLLLRLGIVALAAFLAGAVVQRIKLGDFALKLGPLELPALQRLTKNTYKSVENLTTAVAENKAATAVANRVAGRAVSEVEGLRQRVEALEQKP